MPFKNSQRAVLKLAARVTALLNEHPNAQEAEAACSIAKELASLTSQQSRGIPIRMNHRLK
jgi:hypothetical protein